MGILVNQEFFPNFTELFLFSKMAKMRRKNGGNFFRILDILTEAILAIFAKTTGHRVTKISSGYRISILNKSFFMFSPLTRKKKLFFFYIHSNHLTLYEKVRWRSG